MVKGLSSFDFSSHPRENGDPVRADPCICPLKTLDSRVRENDKHHENNPFNSRLKKGLANYKHADLYRSRHIYDGIIFCSNDYLGLSKHPKVIKAFKDGADKYGVGSGGSQLVTGYTNAHRAVEDAFAEFLNYDRALLFSSGYLANIGVVTALELQTIFADKFNHASLIDAGLFSKAKMYRYAHNNINSLQLRLEKFNSGQKLIISDGVFSMNGNIAQLPELSALAKQYKALLMVDDAHGIGVLGNNGKGLVEHFNLPQKDVPILVCPLGKAFACCGAIVAGSNELIESLIQLARTYIYNTAIPPAIAMAALASLKIIRTETWRREKLIYLINYFKEQAYKRNLTLLPSATAIQSLLIGDAKTSVAISKRLLEHGFVVVAIRPPSVPKNTSRLRITLNCLHTEKQINDLLDQLWQN
jgi:8-amino-7-oxononanoate synthase